jgi:hypothetical protein
MIVKQVNAVIGIVSKIFTFLIIFYSAVLLAKFVWWVFTPSDPDIYVEKIDLNVFENSGKFLINRMPFGVVLGPPVQAKPPIASEIKLTGLYFNKPDNSIAFYEYNNKNYIAKIGDTIGGAATLKSISATGIVVSENNIDVDVEMSKGSSASVPVMPGSTGNTNNFSNSFQQQQNGPANNPQSGLNVQQGSSPDSQAMDLAERRRQLIEEFKQRNAERGAESERSGRP